MPKSHAVATLLAVGISIMASGAAIGQAYPTKPVQVLTINSGGAVDVTLRMIAQGISDSLGQRIIVNNRPSSLHPEDAVARAAPDGYTLLYCANAVWLAPFLRADVPYDPQKDFAPISLTVKGPNVVVVSSSVPARSVQELIALTKAKPRELNVAVTGVGGSPQVAAMLFQSMTGAQVTNVTYKGIAQAFSDLGAGRVHVMFPTLASSLPLIKAGKLRALAVTSTKRAELAPDLPTVEEAGIRGYESVAIHGLFAPANTPAPVITRLNREVVQFLTQPESKDKLRSRGLEIVASSPDELAAAVKTEMQKMSKAIKDAGIKPK